MTRVTEVLVQVESEAARVSEALRVVLTTDEG
jgi:hypothetical protein